MEKLSAELVHLIFEDACDDIRGETARSLGLVSKRFRAIAETFEFRHISVSGPNQVEHLVTRLKSIESENDHPHINIQHLFVCDYTKEHALYEDTRDPDKSHHYRGFSGNFLDTSEGDKIRCHYNDIRSEFWSLVGCALRIAAPTLRSLGLLSFHWPSYHQEWLQDEQLPDDYDLLALLSRTNINFPQLRTLTIRHRYNSEKWKGLGPINAPLLKELWLIVRSCFFGSHDGKVLHPLLQDMHSRHPFLSQLVIRWWELNTFDRIMEVICDNEENGVNSVSNCIRNHVLPGVLKSVVIQLNRTPIFYCGTGLMNHRRQAFSFVEDIENRNIPGLRVSPPTATFPKVGERDYEYLFKQWEERSHRL